MTPTTATTNRELASQAAASVRHPLTLVLLTLTFTTGLIDATSYLGLGHVFTANMTGNVVLLGFGIAGSGGLPVVSPLVSMAAFLVGASAGGLLASRVADRHLAHVGSALGIEVLLTGGAAVFAATANIRPNAVSGDLIVALLAFAMGVRNATVRRLAVPDLTTTVLTMTLTGLAADSRIIGGTGEGTPARYQRRNAPGGPRANGRRPAHPDVHRPRNAPTDRDLTTVTSNALTREQASPARHP